MVFGHNWSNLSDWIIHYSKSRNSLLHRLTFEIFLSIMYLLFQTLNAFLPRLNRYPSIRIVFSSLSKSDTHLCLFSNCLSNVSVFVLIVSISIESCWVKTSKSWKYAWPSWKWLLQDFTKPSIDSKTSVRFFDCRREI